MKYEVTPAEFNTKYGYGTYKANVYKMASTEDIGDYVCMVADGQALPYFCHWHQEKTYEALPKGEAYINYHKIIAEATDGEAN